MVNISQVSEDNSINTVGLEASKETLKKGTDPDFSKMMYALLNKQESDSVNEEELFSATIESKLKDLNEEAASYFKEQKEALTSSLTREDGYIPVEEIANKALKNTLEAKKISKEYAEKIKGESFIAAQLDDNLNALFDSRGSENDNTIATSKVSEALLKLEQNLKKIKDGETPSKPLSLDETSNTESAAQSLDGEGGFLWKPVSEGDGKLVVLLPTELRGKIDRAEIHSALPPSEETKIEEGRFSGDSTNGNRPHFRFDKEGSGYGNDIYLVCYKDDGSYLSWSIEDGAKRND